MTLVDTSMEMKGIKEQPSLNMICSFQVSVNEYC